MRLIPNCLTTTIFIEESIAAWHASSTQFPSLGQQYSEDEQQAREMLFDRAVQAGQAELKIQPLIEPERKEAFRRLTSRAAQLASVALDLHDPYFEFLLREEFSKIGNDLALSARRFNPSVTLSDILQACRNAWTACGLQPLLGQAIQLTPAIFAYSMLYPYSDNYLDDTAISAEAKLAFSSRFRRRLVGDWLPPLDALESAIWQLVSLIESQYERRAYPQVYDCLLDIHNAQEDSIRQLRHHSDNDNMDLLRLTCAKGGTSVLADAFLTAGFLSEPEARFAFEWGVLLQLADDLDDLPLDREHGFVNLFSQAAEREPLDELTNRALNFGQSVMKLMETLPNGAAPFKKLLQRNSSSLLIRAAARSGELYSDDYLAELETYSPLRFSFLKERQEQFTHGAGSYAKLFEALLTSENDEPRFLALTLFKGHETRC
jgi:hypothetical protein